MIDSNQALPQDVMLPNLLVVFDVQVMKSKIEAAMFGDIGTMVNHLRIRECELVHVRYKAGRFCVVAYRLTIEDQSGLMKGTQVVSGRMFQPGQRKNKYLEGLAKPLLPPAFGRPVFELVEDNMVFWAFPNDRKMPSLPSLKEMDSRQTDPMVGMLESHYGKTWKFSSISEEIVHYVPEHTCMRRITLQGVNRETGKDQPLVIYGKTYYNQQGRDTYRAMKELWNSQVRNDGVLMMPAPLGYDASLQTLWQSGLQGAPLSVIAWDDSSVAEMFFKAGGTVAVLHDTSLQGLPHMTKQGLLDTLKETTAQLLSIRPSRVELIHW